jgi:HEAT repeat protein
MNPSSRSALCLFVLALSAGLVRADDADASADDEQTLRSAGHAVDGPALVAFFRDRTPSAEQVEKLKALIRRLGDEDFEEREKAAAALAAVGPQARPQLREAARALDLEVARRAAAILETTKPETAPAVLEAAARLLGHRRPDGAVAALLGFAPFAEEPETLDAVADALTRAGGGADPLLVKALADAAPARRAVAAEALLRRGVAEQRDACSKLLFDADLAVRERVALALLAAGDRKAVPALIRLLGELPRERRWAVEDVLLRVGGDKAPQADRRSVDVWQAWWQAQGGKIDLARPGLADRPTGLTVLSLMGREDTTGRIVGMGAAGTVRWEFGGLMYPVDVQVLGPERVLVCECCGRMTVSERTLTGEVVWEKKVRGVLVGARRLPDGNTFIVTWNRISVVNRDGAEVHGVNVPDGQAYAAARRRDGRIGVATSAGQFVLFAAGEEVKSFPLGGKLMSIGSNIEVLPDGHVLAPLYSPGKVVELDGDGRLVWEAAFPAASSVLRLANGHTLVGSRKTGLVVEFDRSGKEVWRHQSGEQLLRASRR